MAATDRAARAAIALVALWPLASAAADRTAGSVMVYADDDDVTVVSPTASATIEVGDTTYAATVGFDVISAASVDLVSAASPQGFEETRTQVDASGRYDLGAGTSVSGAYALSHEPDFVTHALVLGGTHDLFDRLATLAGSYRLSRSDIGRKGDESFEKLRWTHQADVTWSHVLTARAVADVSYGLTLADGFNSNAYRFVRLYSPTEPGQQTAVTERTPELRVRHAATGRLRARLVKGLFALADYRFYADSWGMQAHTATIRAALAPGEGAWTITAEVRGHLQDAVSFYRPRYETFPAAPGWRTGEKELGDMRSALGGLHVEWAPPTGRAAGLRVGLGADVLHLRYLDHELLPARTALVGIADAAWEW